ncbi:MAG: SDR family oxidoreductase [Halobacteriales archaeon]|nr:SDR family oxidoreductase [Halobacteriales archaeon]
MRLKDKTVLITGSASGIGKKTAERCAEEGAYVVVTDVDSGSGEEVADELGDFDACAGAEFHRLDVTERERFGEVVDKVADERGIDVLVNNAGVGHPSTYLEDISDSVRDYVIGVNLMGVWNGCQAALPHMKEQGSGAIVNVGSLASILGFPKQATYSVTKGAVLNLTRTVAAEAGPFGVRANLVCPGFTDTQLLEQFLASFDDPEEARESMAEEYPLKRLGEPEEVAEPILFLASDEASFVTGHALVIDGGFSIS